MGQVDGAGTVALGSGGLAANLPVPRSARWNDRVSAWAQNVELAPDLGRDIGTARWWRGLATCIGLCALAISTGPGFAPVPGEAPVALTDAEFDQLRAQMITPIAYGADSGLRMGPTDAVAPLASTPERPRIELTAAVGQGDSFARMLQRAGVSRVDADAALDLIGGVADPNAIAPGTPVQIVLGRRPSRAVPRPLESLAVRARLDLALDISRQGSGLAMREIPIAVDDTPLRIRGAVGDGLYRSARAAGADPSTIQTYLKIIAGQVSLLSDIGANDRFDIVVAHRRAATGESETGELLFAGLDRARGKSVNMLRWTVNGRTEWFEASGVGKARPGMSAPVSGRLSSGFGLRRHPILGFSRMHAGIDYAAPSGTPIYAASAGRVVYAGRHGGHGNYVRLAHDGPLGTGYSHMSRIAVHAGERVRQGQVIGYVGSTGLSTGPHLHYEVYRNGAAVNPLSVRFAQAPVLSGAKLRAFKERLTELKSLPVGVSQPAMAGNATRKAVKVASMAPGASTAIAPLSGGAGHTPLSR